MVRHVAPASWLLAAGLLAITVGQHGVWATSFPDPLETDPKEPESITIIHHQEGPVVERRDMGGISSFRFREKDARK